MQSIKNYRILVVDGDLSFQQQLRQQLAKHLEFEGAVNQEKLDRILQNKPEFDLVMLALEWDKDKGFKNSGKVIQKINTYLPTLPILGLVKTALLPEMFEEAMEHGVRSFLTKPTEPELMQEWDQKIRAIIEGKRGKVKEKATAELEEKEAKKEIPRQRILLIDDELAVLAQFKFKFRKKYEVKGVQSEKELDHLLKTDTDFDLILLDLVLDERTKKKDGLNLIPRLKAKIPDAPIFILTGSDDKNTAFEAGTLGAQGFFSKHSDSSEDVPWEPNFIDTIENELAKVKDQLIHMESELRKARNSNQYLNPPERPFIGRSPQIEKIRQELKAVANENDYTVMITGETGVGKGVAAYFLHYNSIKRRAKPFEEIYISNIPKDLVPGELFGSKKGSYTDSKVDKKGRLEAANGGTVFLDEIGDLDLENQARLLQFLNDKNIRTIGDLTNIKLDLQVVTATNKNLEEEIAKGQFRADLYHRLNLFPIEIPPLRARREDIALLVAHFTNTEEKNLSQLFEVDVLRFLIEECPWSGNIRQLENSIRRMQLRVRMNGLKKIDMGCIPEELFRPMPIFQMNNLSQHILDNALTPQNSPTAPPELPLDQQQDWLILNRIESALIAKNGVKNDVAEMLNFKSSDAVRYRIGTIAKKYPGMLSQFPQICLNYAKEISKNNKPE